MFSSKSVKSVVRINGDIVGSDSTENSEDIVINGIRFKIDGANNVEVYVDGNAQKIQTSNGNVYVDGDVTNGVQSSNGDITCTNVTGNVSNSNGGITIRGPVSGDVETVNGDIFHR